jgi:secretion/DNA translocation related TadE-like protein
MTGAGGRDRGSATVVVAMTATAMCALFALVLALGQVVVARHRAGAAADLAALAAADQVVSGQSDACRRAVAVAAAQGADVVRCAVDGEIADVTAVVRLGPYAPAVRSRAGPQMEEEPGSSRVPRPSPSLPRPAQDRAEHP